jgi:hypothetical protein
MDILLGTILLLAGMSMVFLNRWIAERGIEFQQTIGSIWNGKKSLVAMRIGAVLLGAYAALFGVLSILGRLSFL